MRLLLGALLLTLLIGSVIVAHQSSSASDAQALVPGKFVDITSTSGVHFNYLSSHTPKHYLPETMGAGVALFDYDNDGRLDIFLVNGARLSDPTPKGTIPQKTGPAYWNHLFHQKPVSIACWLLSIATKGSPTKRKLNLTAALRSPAATPLRRRAANELAAPPLNPPRE